MNKTTKLLRVLASVPALLGALAGCAMDAQGTRELAEDEEDGRIRQDITRGQLIGGSVLNPLGAADGSLKWASGGVSCTGSKIGPRRILTASHCVDNVTKGGQISVTRDVNGANWTTMKVQALYRYPSDRDYPDSGEWVDAALIDVSADLPGAVVPVRATRVPDTATGTAIAFGCDLNDPSHDGKMQTGQFFAHSYWQPNRYAASVATVGHSWDAQSCWGDSGGPLYFKDAQGRWEVGGISELFAGDTEAWWTRTDIIRAWILDPALNDFRDGAEGAFISRPGNDCVDGSQLKFCQGPDNGGKNQKFALEAVSTGFLIRNTKTGQYLTNAGSGKAVTYRARDRATIWKFIDQTAYEFGDGYRIRDVTKSNCLNVSEETIVDGSTLITNQCHVMALNQVFRFVKR